MTEKQSSKTESFPTQAQVVIIGGGADGIWPACDIWPTVPVENMEMLMAAAKRYGSK